MSKKFNDVGNIKAFLGSGAEFEGLLSFDGTVRIDGLFKGEIQTNDCLIIGESGRVDAELQVGHLIVMGELNGNVRASEKVELTATGHVKGDVITSVLVIQEGASVEGNVQMDSSGGESDKKLISIKDSGDASGSSKAVAN